MIVIDIDGVVANSEQCLRNVIERETGVKFTPKSPRTFSFLDGFKGVSHELLYQLIDKALTLYSDDIQMYDSLDTLISFAELAKVDDKITFLTSRNPEYSNYTYEWLNNNLGCIPFMLHYAYDKAKWLHHRRIIGFDCIIEDRLDTANKCAKEGFDVYLINRPWNIDRDTYPSVVRFDNVSDAIYMYLRKKDC